MGGERGLQDRVELTYSLRASERRAEWKSSAVVHASLRVVYIT